MNYSRSQISMQFVHAIQEACRLIYSGMNFEKNNITRFVNFILK